MSKFQVLSDREHILKRPSMYVGSVDQATKDHYIFDGGKISLQSVTFVGALEKIINEIIDNSVDEFIRTNGSHANKIQIDVSKDHVRIRDNGRGIPVKVATNEDGSPVVVDGEEQYIPVLAWTQTKAGSNFDDDERIGMGMNGVGSSLTNVFSSKFKGVTFDGENALELNSTNNMEKSEWTIQPMTVGKTFTEVEFYPDFSRFEAEEIDEQLINLLKTRVIKLATVFRIEFKFNDQVIRPILPRAFTRMFSEDSVFKEGRNWYFFFCNSPEDEFRQLSIINGLEVKDGNHTDLIVGDVCRYVRSKLVKKYKEIKLGDIRNKLMFVSVMKSFPRFKTDSQTKERMTNSVREIKEFMNEPDWNKMIEKIGNEILKTKSIIDPIVEIYKIKEEFKKRQELKSADKVVKRVVDDNYLPSTGEKKNIFLCEGKSAQGGISPIFGRNGNSYLALKGVPMNVYELVERDNMKKILANAEQTLIKNCLGYNYSSDVKKLKYENIIIATDADADGSHITGLIIGNFYRLIPQFIENGCLKKLSTPVAAVIEGKGKKQKVVQYAMSLEDIRKLKITKKSQKLKYFKGLGTWDKHLLKDLVEREGEDTFISTISIDEAEIIHNWLSSKNAEYRKERILATDFDINAV